jgi:NAD(P)-dependent dehydrogenase (short-subunit alcohol dehydrogenase family)
MGRRVVLVTGGNSGIGFECARALAREGLGVRIASRDRAASVRAVARIRAETANDDVAELGLDLGSLAAVRQLAKETLAGDLPLHALVCNAGLQVNRGPVLTADGYESTFAVNHLGHFLLVNLLLRRLVANAPARIVVVSSGVHDPSLRTGMPKADVRELDTLAATGGPEPGRFDGRLAYVNSKLCNLWFTYELARRVEAAGLASQAAPLAINAWEPGLVPGSGLARDYPPALRFVWDRVLPGIARVATAFFPGISTAEKSGEALAGMVLDPAFERVSGRYYPSAARWREAPSSEASRDPSRARALWEASVRMTGLTPDESPLAGA